MLFSLFFADDDGILGFLHIVFIIHDNDVPTEIHDDNIVIHDDIVIPYTQDRKGVLGLFKENT